MVTRKLHPLMANGEQKRFSPWQFWSALDAGSMYQTQSRRNRGAIDPLDFSHSYSRQGGQIPTIFLLAPPPFSIFRPSAGSETYCSTRDHKSPFTRYKRLRMRQEFAKNTCEKEGNWANSSHSLTNICFKKNPSLKSEYENAIFMIQFYRISASKGIKNRNFWNFIIAQVSLISAEVYNSNANYFCYQKKLTLKYKM